ncbi:MAG: hypothetical protein KDD19_06720 [Phaeodactylibacter sp.]|nr:hypothetical protein [Phaeodactylibacter sp.]MCB9050003.1 cytochrome c family protein [Lewinellaceae bacterium]
MKPGILHLVLLMNALFLSGLQAQLSPGPLSRAHADLEGIANCTQCHTLGEKVSNDKCLNCHKEIRSLISSRSGYHASRDVRGKDCSECHSEHHGRNFDMARFDEGNFNHSLTGYELAGAHRRIDCRQCHIPDFIDEPELKKRKDTFLGLSKDCASCHEDYHQKTLSNDCARCHVPDAFAPATKFDHNQADFALRGKHKDVECIECHRKEIRNGKQFQAFSGVPFSNCNSCHTDVHQSNLGTDCKQCHTEESFSSLSQIRRFNHNQTRFPLKGAHQRVNCADCHNMNTSPTQVFQDRLGVRSNDCASCHKDVHDGQFGASCADCHSEKSFRNINTDKFNHNLTDFRLRGKHEAVDCRKCHKESLTASLPHNTCAACHEDYHEGAFTASVPVRDCADCHTEDGFDVPLFSFEDHSKTKFPLNGAHLATPCFACHLDENKWAFRNIGNRCADCHEDVHQGYLNTKYYPGQSCENCHVTDSWSENDFDHRLTGFELQGAHTRQKCSACHEGVEESRPGNPKGFTGLSAACASCHKSVHGGQFQEDGGTDCARCHGFEDWPIRNFDHDKTAFKLEGRHAEIECGACHKPMLANGEIFTRYKFQSFECVVCHH